MRISLVMAVMALLVSGCAAVGDPPRSLVSGMPMTSTVTTLVCVPVGTWRVAGGPDNGAAPELPPALADAPVLLLGESHDNPAHHRWQLDTITRLHARRPGLVLGFEMFPRRVQPVLDRWVAGELDEKTFLRQSEWRKVWGFDPDFYLPIFRFARDKRLPMVALNVDRALMRRVGDVGWAAVPAVEREGVGDPAPASPAYLDGLSGVYAQHAKAMGKPLPGLDDPGFRRFVEAQLLWDRAMAEGIAQAHRRAGRPVAAIIGAGHLEERHGVPHQLAALGVGGAKVLLPWDRDRNCADLTPRLADAVYGLEAASAHAEPSRRPRLGVNLEAAKDGVLIRAVVPGSVAAAAGLNDGDVIVAAADQPLSDPDDLVDLVRGLEPGASLPLTVRRGTATLKLIAQFPRT